METPRTLFELIQKYMAAVKAAERSGAAVVTYDADTGEDLTPAPKGAKVVRVPWSDTAARALLGVGPVVNRLNSDEYVLEMPNPWTETPRRPASNVGPATNSNDEYVLEMPNPWGAHNGQN